MSWRREQAAVVLTERIATVMTTTKSIAITIATTAMMKRKTIQRDSRRVAACRAKKSMAAQPRTIRIR